MYRFIRHDTPSELALRMLLQPAASGLFHRACEADSYRGLVAALLDDPTYETAAVADRLEQRIRMAGDLVLLSEVEGNHLVARLAAAPDHPSSERLRGLPAGLRTIGARRWRHQDHHRRLREANPPRWR